MAALEKAILTGADITADETVAKHAAWLEAFRNRYEFTPENTQEILHREIGKTFVRVLEDAGVYKCTKEGRGALRRFLSFVNRQ